MPALGRPPMEGLGNTACRRMPGAWFEPCTRLDHLGWLRYPCLSNPAFSASDRSLFRRRVRLDLAPGSATEQQLNQLEPAWFLRFSVAQMHLPVTGLFRVPGSVSSSHHPSPLQEQRTTGHTSNRLSIQSIAMYGVTDFCVKTLGKYCSWYVSKCRALLLRPTTDDMRSI